MIGTLPVSQLAPLDYRSALDAAAAMLSGCAAPLLLCNAPELSAELRQRMPLGRVLDRDNWNPRVGSMNGRVDRNVVSMDESISIAGQADGALWVEPPSVGWQEQLETIARALVPGAPLAIVASRLLARLLPERRSWIGQPLGMCPLGLAKLRGLLGLLDLELAAIYGFHTVTAIALSMLGGLAARLGRLALSDRLGFAARLHYCTSGLLVPFSTVALFLLHKRTA